MSTIGFVNALDDEDNRAKMWGENFTDGEKDLENAGGRLQNLI